MTWFSLVVRLGGFAVLLPIVLVRLTDAEVSVWLLFSAIAGLQLVADFGFGPTFSREIAYGFTGRSVADGDVGKVASQSRESLLSHGPDWGAIGSTMAAMLWLYRRIAVCLLILLSSIGTWAVTAPIARVPQSQAAWIAWCVVAGVAAVGIYGNAYAAFLVGANRIDLQKRWEAVIGAVSLLAQIGIALLGKGLLGLVVIAQIGFLVQVLVNRSLAYGIGGPELRSASPTRAPPALVAMLWPAAWRTAVGAIMGLGVAQGISVAMANVLPSAEAASVQLALRLMQIISQFSQVPFYARIPLLNRLRARGELATFVEIAKGGMRTSLWIYVIGMISIDAIARELLSHIGSRTQLPGGTFWALLMLAGLAERYGAMHINLLMTANWVISHIANGIAGLISIAVLSALFSVTGALALPISLLLAQAGFYAVFSARSSYRILSDVKLYRLDIASALPPSVVALAWVAQGFAR